MSTEQPQAVEIVCPRCKGTVPHTLQPSISDYDLRCPKCRARFASRVVCIRSKTDKGTPFGRRFVIRVLDLAGREALIEFKNKDLQNFQFSPGDVGVFSYLKKELRLMQNATVGQWLVVGRAPCYLATYVYGQESDEVTALCAFRDRVLVRSAACRLLVELYYLVSPLAVSAFGGRRVFRSVVSVVLSPVVRAVRRWHAHFAA